MNGRDKNRLKAANEINFLTSVGAYKQTDSKRDIGVQEEWKIFGLSNRKKEIVIQPTENGWSKTVTYF